jgi:hypothetical protein
MPPRKATAEKVEQAIPLLRTMSVGEAAAQVGLSDKTLGKYLVFRAEPVERQGSEPYTEIPVIHRHYDAFEALYVYPLGDVHKGAEAHDADRWHDYLDYLAARDDASFLGTGDYLNSAIEGSKSDVYSERGTVGDNKRELRRELQPLADAGRIDLLMPGNHENRIWRAVGDCPIRDVADTLDVPYVRTAALLVYHVGDVDYTVYVKHGTGAGGVGARANRLEKAAQTSLSDVYVSGHTHSQLCFPSQVFQYDEAEDRVVRRTRYFVSSGSFVGSEPYAITAGYSPTKVGAPRIRLDGTRHDVHVSL